MVEAVLAYSGVPSSGVACEIGCGTGRATTLFAARGVPIVALEPSPEMAAIATTRCAAFPNVRIDVVPFEAWTPENAPFALVLAAQSWHWVDPEQRLVRAASILDPGGSLALCWNQPDWLDHPLRNELDELYQELAPELVLRRPGYPCPRPRPERSAPAVELSQSPLFRALEILEFRWTEHYSASGYTSLLETQSDHRMLPARARARLLDAIRALLERHGGDVSLDYVTELYLTRRVS
jgi:SAM-dependent methyltransferase